MSRGIYNPEFDQGLVVQSDATIEQVSIDAYGTPAHAGWISTANGLLPSGIVRAGTKLIIPGKPPAISLVGKQPDEMTFIVDDLEIPMLNARIIRAMDTGTSGWTGRFPWTPGADPALDRATRPYGYGRAAAYIGNELLVSGALYITAPEKLDTGITKVITGFSFTADAVDSNVQPRYEKNGATLEQIAAEQAAPLGIEAIFETDTGGAFELATAHESDTIFGFLSKLATERGLLVGDTPEGNLRFYRANTGGEPVGTIEESQSTAVGWKAQYDGRKRFNKYKCINAQGTGTAVPLWGVSAPPEDSEPITVTATDDSVPLSRFQSFRADDTTPGNVADAAQWRKNRQFVDALSQPLSVVGWYAPNGKLWRENTLVTVVSPTLGVPSGFTFLIRSVEFVLEDRRTTVLQLIPPEAYSNKDIGDVWKLE